MAPMVNQFVTSKPVDGSILVDVAALAIGVEVAVGGTTVAGGVLLGVGLGVADGVGVGLGVGVGVGVAVGVAVGGVDMQ